MGENSGIAWTEHTFNPWWGCTKVDAACENCYAEQVAARFQIGWGPKAEPRFFGLHHWNDPIRWNSAAEATGKRARVFSGSMCDIFEIRDAPLGARMDHARIVLFGTIENTPALDWLLLTKRPENLRSLLPFRWQRQPLTNVWLGITAVTQQQLEERAALLGKIPAKLRFLSLEPLIQDVDVSRAIKQYGIGWVIVGGESGPHARPFNTEWARSIVRQCRAAGVPCFVKQLGANCHTRNDDNFTCEDEPDFPAWPHHLTAEDRIDDVNAANRYQGAPVRIRFRERAGADPAEWRTDLTVRERP
jgi:protein gp37